MTMQVHLLPYPPQDGSAPKWEVSIVCDREFPAQQTWGLFDTQREAMAFVDAFRNRQPRSDAHVTVRAVHG